MYNYFKNGFEIITMNNSKKLISLRKKIINLFSLASQLSGNGKINSDKDILSFYKKDKKSWIMVYDQMRMLPDLYQIINSELIKKVTKISGIKFPSYTSKPVIRIVMPGNKGTSKTKLHIDYPTHRGSSNAVTVWFPLQSITKKNGTLIVAPNSHLKKNYYGSIQDNNVVRKDNIYESKKISVPLNIGQGIVFSHFLAHKSGDNFSDKIRFSIDFRLNDLQDKDYFSRKYYINEKTTFKKL